MKRLTSPILLILIGFQIIVLNTFAWGDRNMMVRQHVKTWQEIIDSGEELELYAFEDIHITPQTYIRNDTLINVDISEAFRIRVDTKEFYYYQTSLATIYYPTYNFKVINDTLAHVFFVGFDCKYPEDCDGWEKLYHPPTGEPLISLTIFENGLIEATFPNDIGGHVNFFDPSFWPEFYPDFSKMTYGAYKKIQTREEYLDNLETIRAAEQLMEHMDK